MRQPRRLRAWRSGFDLAVAVFRLTAGLEDARTNGFARRLRDDALRVPALIARAAHRNCRARCRADLREARRSLDELAVNSEWLRALVYVDLGEATELSGRLASARHDLIELEGHLLPGGDGEPPAPRSAMVESEKYKV